MVEGENIRDVRGDFGNIFEQKSGKFWVNYQQNYLNKFQQNLCEYWAKVKEYVKFRVLEKF